MTCVPLLMKLHDVTGYIRHRHIACKWGGNVSESQNFMCFLFLFKGCFPFGDLSPLLTVNLKSHCQPTFPQPAKGKESRALNSFLPLQGPAIGTTAMLCVWAGTSEYLFVSCLHLTSAFSLCLLYHTLFWCSSCNFLKAFSSFSNLLHLFKDLV